MAFLLVTKGVKTMRLMHFALASKKHPGIYGIRPDNARGLIDVNSKSAIQSDFQLLLKLWCFQPIMVYLIEFCIYKRDKR
jgi:hypothetical protein